MRTPSALSTWRRAAAAGVTALALTGVAACGGGGHSGIDLGLGSASDSASDAGASSAPESSGASSSGTSSTHQPGDSITASEAADITKKAMSSITTAHMTMEMSTSAGGQSIATKAYGDIQMSPLAEDITMTIDPLGQVHAILADGTMYMQMPSSAGLGDKWVKLDMSDLGSVGMSGASDALTNPMEMLDKFSAAITAAKYDGSDSTGEHYTFTIDTAKAMSVLGSSASADTSQLPPSLTEDMWLDDQGRVSQMKMEMGTLGDVTMNMSDFGKSVSIQAPPASDTTSMPTP